MELHSKSYCSISAPLALKGFEVRLKKITRWREWLSALIDRGGLYLCMRHLHMAINFRPRVLDDERMCFFIGNSKCATWNSHKTWHSESFCGSSYFSWIVCIHLNPNGLVTINLYQEKYLLWKVTPTESLTVSLIERVILVVWLHLWVDNTYLYSACRARLLKLV